MKKRSFAAMAATLLACVTMAGCGYDDTSLDLTKIDVDKYVSAVGDYSNLTVETIPMMEVTDDTVQDYIDYVLQMSGLQGSTEVNRPIQDGDIANIDYKGLKDGVAFDGGTAEGYDLTIGSGTFISGFESGLLGYKAGDEVSLDLVFPEDYGKPDLAGAAVVFEVKINSVSEPAPAELTDDVVVMFGIPNVTNVEQFKDYIRKSLEDNAKATYDNQLRDNVLSAIYDSSTFTDAEVPQNLKNYYYNQITAEDQNYADQYGVSLEQYVTDIYGMDYAKYQEDMDTQATVMVRDAMICEKIARAEKIKITDRDYEAQVVIDATEYGYESTDAFKAAIDEQDYKNYLKELRVIDMVLEKTTVVDSEQ